MPEVYQKDSEVYLGGTGPQLAGRPAEEPPPSCNTGVESAHVSVDHMAGTWRGSCAEDFKSKVPGEWVERETGWRNYRRSSILRIGDGVVLVGEDMKGHPGLVHYQFSGVACQSLGLDFLRDMAHETVKRQGHFTRVDMAYDDRAGILNLDMMEQAIQTGQCVTRSREKKRIKGLGKSLGDSIMIGSGESASHFLIYDKAAERQDKGYEVEGPWIRVEARYRDEQANAVGIGLACKEWELFKRICIGNLINALDFRNTSIEETSWQRSRAGRLSWWAQFTENLEKARWVIPMIKKTIVDVARWLEEQVFPNLAMAMTHKDYGEKWVYDGCQRAIDKWKAKHWEMLKERKPAMAGA